jgi:hypothetical protein
VKYPTWMLGLAACCAMCSYARAEDSPIVPGLTYVCNGEKLHIDSCNIRDLSDNSTCLVAHPDHMRPNGFPTYTNETRGNLKKLLPSCQQPSAQQQAAARNFQQKQQATVDANFKKAEATQPVGTQADVMRELQPKDPEERAMNRCIAAGRLPASCTGNALLGSFSKMLSSVAPAAGNSSAPPAGPVMAGVYQGVGNWRLDFVDGGVLVNCGILSPNEETYSLKFEANRTALIIHTKPAALDLTFHADGTIVGPVGPVTIDGVIASGYHSGDNPNAVYKDAAGNEYDGNRNKLQTTAGYSTFSSKRTTCPAINLTSKGASVGIQTMQTDLLKTAFGGSKGPPTPPGIRMQGIYAAPSGLSVQFFPESAIVGCGPDAARAYPYTVVAGQDGAVVRIEAPDHPLSLSIRPENKLDPGGTEAYQVHGRFLLSGGPGGNSSFLPNEQSCGLAVLAPAAAIPTNGGAAPLIRPR